MKNWGHVIRLNGKNIFNQLWLMKKLV